MGRSPDYKAAFLATYGPNADYYAPFQDNARRWYKESQERVYFMNHTLVNPPVDRDKDIHEVSDVFIHAVKETDEGVIVRGAKMVATGSALSPPKNSPRSRIAFPCCRWTMLSAMKTWRIFWAGCAASWA